MAAFADHVVVCSATTILVFMSDGRSHRQGQGNQVRQMGRSVETAPVEGKNRMLANTQMEPTRPTICAIPPLRRAAHLQR
jgi:hypothetical protein